MNSLFKSSTHATTTDCGKMYIIVTRNSRGEIVKIIADLGKSGTCAKAQLSAYCDLLSTLFLMKVTLNTIILGLRAASGHTCSMRKSCIDTLNRHLINVLENEKMDEEVIDE